MLALCFVKATSCFNALMFFFTQILMLFAFMSDAHQERHFLHYRFTALSGTSSFPEFSAAAVADDRLVAQCSDEDRLWVQTEEEHTHSLHSPPDSRSWMMEQIRTLTDHTHSTDRHVLQRMTGCELERFPNGSESLRAFDDYGFDGEDFISFDSESMKWIEKNPKAKETKKKWDLQTGRNQFIKYYLKTCMSWISTFNNTRNIGPRVHVFVSRAPDEHSDLVLTCHVTGFYPRDVGVYIRLNETMVEGQESSGVRPNADGSFQMRNRVKIDRRHEGLYDCVVTHSALTETISVKLAGARDCESESVSVIPGLTGALLTVAVVVCVCLIYRKKTDGMVKMLCYDCGRKKTMTENSLHPALTDQMNVHEYESAVMTKQTLEER